MLPCCRASLPGVRCLYHYAPSTLFPTICSHLPRAFLHIMIFFGVSAFFQAILGLARCNRWFYMLFVIFFTFSNSSRHTNSYYDMFGAHLAHNPISLCITSHSFTLRLGFSPLHAPYYKIPCFHGYVYHYLPSI